MLKQVQLACIMSIESKSEAGQIADYVFLERSTMRINCPNWPGQCEKLTKFDH